MSQLVKTKRQTNFIDFNRFGAFKGLVERKTLYSTRSYVNWDFGTRGPLKPKWADFRLDALLADTMLTNRAYESFKYSDKSATKPGVKWCCTVKSYNTMQKCRRKLKSFITFSGTF
jgi:hypothetical protein